MNKKSLIKTVDPEKQMSDADYVKTEFVFVASHQLRTPLTAMKLYLEMLLEDETQEPNAERIGYLKNIYQATKRMVHLVDDLLDISRIESGVFRVDPVAVDLNAFFSSIVQEIEPIAHEKDCQVILNIKNVYDALVLDPKLLHVVIQNLLVNAVRYSNKKKSVVRLNVRLAKKAKQTILQISVVDKGVGIPKAVQKHIFEKFFRAENAFKVQTDGSGLGLYLAKMVTELMGGTIEFTSSQKAGTTFIVEIPLSLSEKPLTIKK